jgi:hypothetical protein
LKGDFMRRVVLAMAAMSLCSGCIGDGLSPRQKTSADYSALVYSGYQANEGISASVYPDYPENGSTAITGT